MSWLTPPPILYKYLPPTRLDVLETLKLRFSPPASFNDPFDCRAPARSIVDHREVDDGGVQDRLHRISEYARRRMREECDSLRQKLDEYEKSRPKQEAGLPSFDCLVRLGPPKFPIKFDLGSAGSAKPFLPSVAIFGGKGWVSGRLSPTRERPIVMLGGYEKQSRFNELGVLSLSARGDNPVMWSHYTDSHRGFVVGLSTDNAFFERDVRSFFVREIGYFNMFDDLPEFPFGFDIPTERQLRVPPVTRVIYSDLRTTASPVAPGEGKLRDRPEYEIMDFGEMLFKAEDWAYEQEWRMFRRLKNECPWDDDDARGFSCRPGFRAHEMPFCDPAEMPVILFDLPPSCISEVILGINMSIEDRRRAAIALRNNPTLAHVQLKLAVSNPATYTVETVLAEPPQVATSVDVTLEDLQRQSDFREAIQYWPDRLLEAMMDRFKAGPIQGIGFTVEFAVEAMAAELQARTGDAPTRLRT